MVAGGKSAELWLEVEGEGGVVLRRCSEMVQGICAAGEEVVTLQTLPNTSRQFGGMVATRAAVSKGATFSDWKSAYGWRRLHHPDNRPALPAGVRVLYEIAAECYTITKDGNYNTRERLDPKGKGCATAVYCH